MIDPASRLHGHHHEREMMMMMMTYRRPLCVLFQLFTVLEVPIEPPTHVEQHARHIKPTQVEVRSCKKQQRERFSASRQHPSPLCGVATTTDWAISVLLLRPASKTECLAQSNHQRHIQPVNNLPGSGPTLQANDAQPIQHHRTNFVSTPIAQPRSFLRPTKWDVSWCHSSLSGNQLLMGLCFYSILAEPIMKIRSSARK